MPDKEKETKETSKPDRLTGGEVPIRKGTEIRPPKTDPPSEDPQYLDPPETSDQ